MKAITLKEWQYRKYDQLEKKVLSMPSSGASQILKEHCFFLLSLYRDCLADMEGQLSLKIMDDIYREVLKLESLV